MKSLMLFWQELSIELGSISHTSTLRDCKTVADRSSREGSSFLTITLPAFGKDFEKSLDRGFVAHDLFTGFRFRGGLPCFLGGFLEQIFDRKDGLLLDEPNIDSIFAVRQLTLLCGKIEAECSDARNLNAIERFVECEREVEQSDRSISDERWIAFERLSLLAFAGTFAEMDRKIYDEELLPKHGPGATADKLTGNQKFNQNEWPERLEKVFPFVRNASPSLRFGDFGRAEGFVTFLEPEAERPVRVVLVPKTPKTPRVIAIEPTCMQFMQQAILEPLIELLEAPRTVDFDGSHNQGRHLIGFRSQSPNRDLARAGSETLALATLDMREASDRVSVRHVRHLLARFPSFLEAVEAVRSTKAEVPGLGIIPLVKHASMGSALCFPFEAMTFLVVVLMGIEKKLSRPLTSRDIKHLEGRVRIYGDDIIVPTDCVDSVISELEAFGLVVNTDKSFWTGKFRESCGGDYYDGWDVTPVRVRRQLPQTRKDAQEVISWVSLRNQLYFKGLWRTARILDNWLEKFLPHYPTVQETSPVLGRHTFLLDYQVDRMCDRLHRPLVKGFVPYSKSPNNPVDGSGALLKFFLKRGEQPYADAEHLLYSGRPEVVGLKLRWSTPF